MMLGTQVVYHVIPRHYKIQLFIYLLKFKFLGDRFVGVQSYIELNLQFMCLVRTNNVLNTVFGG